MAAPTLLERRRQAVRCEGPRRRRSAGEHVHETPQLSLHVVECRSGRRRGQHPLAGPRCEAEVGDGRGAMPRGERESVRDPFADALRRCLVEEPGQAAQQAGDAGGKRRRDLVEHGHGSRTCGRGDRSEQGAEERRQLDQLGGSATVHGGRVPCAEQRRPRRRAHALERARKVAIGSNGEPRRQGQRDVEPCRAQPGVPCAGRLRQRAEERRVVQLAAAVQRQGGPPADVVRGEHRQCPVDGGEELVRQALAAPARVRAQAQPGRGPRLEPRRICTADEGCRVLRETMGERRGYRGEPIGGGAPAGAPPGLSRRWRPRRHRSRARPRGRR